jgi:hypothetical protein
MMLNLLKHWINRVISTKSYLEYDDLHLNELFGEIKHSNYVRAVNDISYIIKTDFEELTHHGYYFGIGSNLVASYTYIGIDYKSIDELLKQVVYDSTSLYLFDKYNAPWFIDKECTVKLNENLIRLDYPVNIYHYECKDAAEDVYRRSLWISQPTHV